jgi:hypothetical protein
MHTPLPLQHIIVLATQQTAAGPRLAALVKTHAQGARVSVVPMPGLADMVEAGEVSRRSPHLLVCLLCIIYDTVTFLQKPLSTLRIAAMSALESVPVSAEGTVRPKHLE